MRTSVILPVFNSEATVERAVRSVLSQTDRDFELLIIDDGSSDGSADVLAAVSDARVSILRHSENRGISAARNTGLKHARGDFIAFLDADDEWAPSFLWRMHASRGDAEAVVCGRTVVLPDGRARAAHSRRQGVISGDDAAKDMLTGRITPFPWDKLIARAAFAGLAYPEDIHRFEDQVVGVVALSRVSTVVSISDALIRYHVAAGSLTWGRVPRVDEADAALRFAADALGDWLRPASHANAFAVCRTLFYLLTAQSAMRSTDRAAGDAVLAGCRRRLSPRLVATALRRAPLLGGGALLLSVAPRLYAGLFRAYVKRQYALS